MTVSRSLLFKIFVAALAIRWTYSCALYLAMDKSGLMGADSIGYLRVTEDFVANLLNGHAQLWEWVGPHPQMMPLFVWLLNISILTGGPLVYVLLQGAIDAGTCVLIYALAYEVFPRFALPAAIASIINPTQIVMSGLIYPDTPFVFFVTMFLYGSARWLRQPSWPSAMIVGAGIGCASLFRILVGPWVPVHLFILLAATIAFGQFRMRHAAQIAVIGTIFCLAITPILVRNVVHYNSFSLTTQGGVHLAIWIVPLVKEAADGTPWIKTAHEMQRKTIERYGPTPANPFEASQQQTEIGREVFWSLGIPAIAKAWVNGAAINIASPAVVLVPPVAQLPRTGFYDTRGDSLPGKIFNFVFRSDNALFAQLLLFGIVGVGLIRLLQLYGLLIALGTSTNKTALCLLMLWAGYILAISGPIASPKYRLPIEPVFMVLTGAGLAGLDGWRRKRRFPHS